jgi:uncharacterized protein (TIGR02145 family)
MQPDFKVEVTDSAGALLDSCGYFYFPAPNNGPPPSGWHLCSHSSGDVYWKDWTTVGMDLTPYFGQKVFIIFTARGCWYNTHFGYAYVSAFCGYLEVTTAMCEGDTSAVLTAPPGFNYLWSTGDTTPSIIVPHPVTGAGYSCTLTAKNGCRVTIYDTLTYTIIHSNFTYGIGCAGLPMQFNDSSYVNQNSVTGWHWDFGDASPVVTGNPNPVHTYATSGNFNVTLISNSTEGCKDTIIKMVHVDSLPTITNTTLRQRICNNTTTNITLTSTVSNTHYTWTTTVSSLNISGYSDNPVTPGLFSNQTLINSGNTLDSVIYHFIPSSSLCTGLDKDFTVTVCPVPKLLNSPLLKTICDSLSTNIVLTSNLDSTRFTWTCSANPGNHLNGYSNYTTPPGTLNINQVIYNSGYNIDTVHYHLTGNAYGCNGPAYDYNVAVLPMPDLSNVTLNKSLCSQDFTNVPLTSNVAGTQFTWTCTPSGPGITGWANNAVPTTFLNQQLFNANTTPGTVTYSITPHANSCDGHVYQYTVTVNPLPTATIAGTTSVCQNSAAPLVTFTGGSGTTPYNFTYNINGLPNQTITTIAGNSVTIAVPTNTVGTFTYNLVSVQDGSSTACSQPQIGSATVTVNVLPIPPIAGAHGMCLNTSGTYTTTAGMSGYSWTVTAGGTITSGSTTNSITIIWTANGLQTITLNYTDANGCTAATPSSFNVTVNTLPVPSLSGLSDICTGFSTTYTSDPGMNNYSWTVSPGGSVTAGGSAADDFVTVLWSTVGAQSVSVNYVNGTVCTAASPTVKNVTVHPLPTPTIAGTSTLCAGTSGVVYASQPGMTNYVWNVSAGGSITAGGGPANNTVTVTWNTPGAQTVSVNYNDANGCTALAPTVHPVTVNPLPVPSVNGPASVCLNSTTTYLTDAGMFNYIWNVSAGGSITSALGTNSINVLWSTTGVKTITVNYNDANGCTAPAPFNYTVTVNILPVPALNGLNVICSGNSTIYTTDAGMNNYIWLVSPGGSISAGGGPADNSVTVTWNTPGNQTVSVNYAMATGCMAASPTVVNVNVKPRPSVTNAANSTICSNVTTNIALLASLPLTTFSWTATPSSGNVSGQSNSAGAVISQTLVNSGFNIETVDYAVTPSLNGCDGPVAHYIVTVDPVADAYFIPNGQTLCSGSTSNISILSHVAGATFTWNAVGSSGNITGFGPGATPSITQTLTNSGTGPETVTYTISPVFNGCPGTPNSVVVTVNPLPSVTYSVCNDQITTTAAQPFKLKGGLPPGGTYAGAGVNTGIFYPSIAGVGNHSITYSYLNTWGCTANAILFISVINPVVFLCDNIMTDIRDNKQYPTVKLGTQCWMAANLDYGTVIASSQMQRDNCTLEKYCFNDNLANCTSYGGLYQWDELMQYNNVPAAQGFCPPGWHVPTENEWTTLFNFYISNGFAGSPLKFTGYSGFNAFLSGTRFNNVNWNFSNFAVMFWSSTAHDADKAWAHGMNTFNPSVSYYPSSRTHAFNLRCIKD